MGVAETDDGTVFMLIASAIFIYARLITTINVMRYGVGVGAELHDAEGRTSPREGMSHTICPDDGVDVLDIISIVTVGALADGKLFVATQGH